MPYGQRVTNQIGTQAESEKEFTDFVYNDTSGNLTVGLPVYLDVTDSAEFNTIYSGTAVSGSGSQTQSGKRVVLGTNANAGRLAGIFQPDTIGTKPNKGDVIKCLIWGPGLVSAAAKSSGTAVKVDSPLVGDTSQTSLLASASPALGNSAGQATATGTAISPATTIISVPGSGTTTQIINAFVNIQ